MPRVSLVDDDAAICEILAVVLRGEGYQTRQAATQAEALALVDAEAFDLIVTDIAIHQGKDSLLSIFALRDHFAPIPVGVMTGWPVTEEEVRAAGFAFLVTKPFDVDQLLSKIAAAVRVPRAAHVG